MSKFASRVFFLLYGTVSRVRVEDYDIGESGDEEAEALTARVKILRVNIPGAQSLTASMRMKVRLRVKRRA